MGPDRCPANQRDIWSIASCGGLLQVILAAVRNIRQPATQATALALEAIQTTHKGLNLFTAALTLEPLLRALLHGEGQAALDKHSASIHAPLTTGKQLFEAYNAHKGPENIPKDEMWRLHTELEDKPVPFAELSAQVRSGETAEADVVGRHGKFVSACYVAHALPACVFYAMHYGEDVQGALLASTNAGGDNVGRNSILGAMLGARVGLSGLPAELLDGLADRQALEAEINAFVASALGTGGAE